MILVRGEWLNRTQVVRFTMTGGGVVLSDESYATQADAEAACAIYATGDRP